METNPSDSAGLPGWFESEAVNWDIYVFVINIGPGNELLSLALWTENTLYIEGDTLS